MDSNSAVTVSRLRDAYTQANLPRKKAPKMARMVYFLKQAEITHDFNNKIDSEGYYHLSIQDKNFPRVTILCCSRDKVVSVENTKLIKKLRSRDGSAKSQLEISSLSNANQALIRINDERDQKLFLEKCIRLHKGGFKAREKLLKLLEETYPSSRVYNIKNNDLINA